MNNNKKNLKQKLHEFNEYHQYKIPIILSVFSVFLATAFLDFDIGDFKLKSHMTILVNLVDKPMNNAAALFLFFIILPSIIQLANGFSFNKNKKKISGYLGLIIFAIQGVSNLLYLMVFINEMQIRPTVKFDQPMALALITITLSTILTLVSVIYMFVLSYKKNKVIQFG